MRIAILTDPAGVGQIEVEPAVVSAAHEAAKLLEGLGHDVDEAAPPIERGQLRR